MNTQHYLNVPGTEWEHSETNRDSGRKARKRFTVPMLVDAEQTVYQGDRPLENDIAFIGDPTPDMTPLDDEAQAISDRCAPRWIHPIDALPGQFSQSLLTSLEKQLTQAMAQAPTIPNVSQAMVPKADFDRLQAQVAELMAKVGATAPAGAIAAGGGAGSASPKAEAGRRV